MEDKVETNSNNSKWPQIALALLVIYTLTLAVASADEIFGFGIFPTRLERMIKVSIGNLGSSNATIRDDAKKEIELYGDFAVPQLIRAMDNSAIKDQAIELLKSVSGKDMGSDPKAWREWDQQHKHEF
jgi:hypothetical protein